MVFQIRRVVGIGVIALLAAGAAAAQATERQWETQLSAALGGAGAGRTATAAGRGDVAQLPPPGSQLAATAGNGQQLVPGAASQPLVVTLLGPSGQPLAQEAVLWEVTSPPRGIVVVGGAEVVAVPLLAGGVTFTNGAGRAENRVQVLLPIPATIRASVRGTTLAVTFTVSAGLDRLDGIDPNQLAVADAIDVACPALVGELNSGNLDSREADLLGRCSDMIFGAATQGAGVNRALDEVTAEELASQQTLAFEVPSSQLANVRSRVTALRAGVRGVSVRGLSFDFAGGRFAGDWVQPLFDPMWQQQDDDPLLGASLPRLGLFLNGRVGAGEKDATVLEDGFDFDTAGLTGGIDYRVRDTTVLGFAAGIDRSEADFASDQGTLEVDGYTAAAYLTTYNDGGVYVDVTASFGQNAFALDRHIRYTLPAFDGSGPVTVDQTASADPDGDQLSASLELGWDLGRGGFTFAPFLRGTYTDLTIDAYEERMSNPTGVGSGLALAVDEQSLTSTVATAGFDLTWTVSMGNGVIVPQLRAEYQQELEDDAEPVTARFVFDPSSTPFLITPDTPDDSFGSVGAGISAVFARGLNLFLFYDTLVGLEDLSSHSLSFGLRLER
jgi:uncharacterized protein YhjY with autotransporter beta-barrel domain